MKHYWVWNGIEVAEICERCGMRRRRSIALGREVDGVVVWKTCRATEYCHPGSDDWFLVRTRERVPGCHK